LGVATKIQWTEETWNPVRARNIETGKVGWFCEHMSDGCRFCYAEAMNNWRGNRVSYQRQNRDRVEIFLDESALCKPLTWKKPRTIFPCSMTDIGADFIKDEWLGAIFSVMAETPQHIYQPLTKRPDRIANLMNGPKSHADWHPKTWHRSVLPNVHFGTSIEQKRHLGRLDYLRATPAAVRWISLEPLLEDIGRLDLTGISWAVIGGESGRHARPFYLRWAFDIMEQCARSGVAVFMKQIGSNPVGLDGLPVTVRHDKGGDPNEWPDALRVRQMPPRGDG
jgi:protein gp37